MAIDELSLTKHLQKVFDTIREALIILDESLDVVSANRSFYRQFHVSPDETENRPIYELGNRQWDIPELRRLLETVIPEHASFDDFVVKHRFERIGERVMLLNARRMERVDGKPALILLAMDDITDHYEAERRLKESEAKYRKFVEDINSIIIGFDREGRITFFNHFSEELFGYRRDEVMRKPFIGTIIPEIDSRGRDNRPIADEIFADPARYYANESEGVRKDGSRLWFSWNSKAIRDQHGAIREILIDGNDMTSLLAARRNIEEKSALLDTLLEAVPEAIVVTDAGPTVQTGSRYARDLFGMPVELALRGDQNGQLDALELYWPDGKRVARIDDLPLFSAATAGERCEDCEMVLKRNGASFVLSLSAAPIRNPAGAVVGAVGAWRDITRRKEAENQLEQRARQLAEANRDLEAFSYSVSHDLRNPLAAIGFLTAGMREKYGGQLDERGLEYLRRIDDSVRKMQRLIEDVLHLSRAGRDELRRENVDLGEVAWRCLRDLRELEPDRRVELIVQEDVHACADPRLVHVALENLLHNAWKYTSTRECARIELGTTVRDGRDVFYVRDNGVGFDTRAAEQIFAPFQRAHSQREFAGSGIGLSTVKRIVNRHGGEIWAEGAPDKGATFYFSLG